MPDEVSAHEHRGRSDAPFLTALGALGGFYILLIVALLVADALFLLPAAGAASPAGWLSEFWAHFARPLSSEEIRYSIKLSLISCSVTALLSLWIAVPLGYLLARYEFHGKQLVDAILDIPIVLPPLVIGLSLLILFQTPPGKRIEYVTQHHMGVAIAYFLLPAMAALATWIASRHWQNSARRTTGSLTPIVTLLSLGILLFFRETTLASVLQRRLGTPITYAVPSVILAQFSVACAFAVRTMRVTFDQLSARPEQVALTLGCSRSQAFWLVVLPEARRGIVTAGTLAWARSLGEFGPILVFSGATRLHTEVLPSSVFLELSVGNLEAAVAVSLLMVAAALAVLVIVRVWGMSSATQ